MTGPGCFETSGLVSWRIMINKCWHTKAVKHLCSAFLIISYLRYIMPNPSVLMDPVELQWWVSRCYLWKMDLSVTIGCIQINNRARYTSFSLLKLIISRLPFEIGSCIGLGKFWVMHVLAQGGSVQFVFSKWWETMYIQFWASVGKLILGSWWGILPHLYCTTTHLLNFSLGSISCLLISYLFLK